MSRLLLLLLLLVPAAADPVDPSAVTLVLPRARMALALDVQPGGASSLLRPGEVVLATLTLSREGAARRTAPVHDGTLVVSGLLGARQTPGQRGLGVIRRLLIAENDGEEPVPLEGYELAIEGRDGDLRIPVEIPDDGGFRESYLLVDYSRSSESELEPELVEDPMDPAPLGDRRAVILVHGRWFGDRFFSRHQFKSLTWRSLRKAPGYAGLFDRAKFYFYNYPSYRHPRDCAADLRRLVREKITGAREERERLVLVGMSLGGLIIRWAMNQERFGDQVGLALSTATPHHGTAGASLAYANRRIRERVGRFHGEILRLAGSVQPDSPGLRALRWDNFDSAITPEDAARFGIETNPELADLNARDEFQDRLVCLGADVESLIGNGLDYGLIVELLRRAGGKYHAPWGNADPFTTRDSAIFAAGSPATRIEYRNFGHVDMIQHEAVVADILDLLRHELAAP